MIDPKFKKRWLRALRSGKYSQAHETLHNGEGFCCLGVACDVGIDGDWACKSYIWTIEPDDTMKSGEESTLPDWFKYEIGMSDTEEDILVRLNDNDRLELPEIADWIEANL